ncbi:MAG: hypothetical protein A3C07_03095 [Candidatus Sungbacteria bacterium RIFCSPHIGHO2_02_FULL_47_11]|uniref:Uncharacterized protein n=1 Tax=Candidatus Sungbacteria bacterium RIFCSPHIGHO2_02_FULL_47_11 TaxID=1802270 RepID=A0A1G2KKV0_9BACT|nr:MAG: hypothetical protein A3C07_03095 [Candidatus Sungbacteria bacterium RIFCSPHIGHO2_02_FULL_47_11]
MEKPRKIGIPQESVESTEYAGREAEYEPRTVVETTDGERIVIVDYLKEQGLYVVSKIDKPDVKSSLFRISPSKIKPKE